MPTADAAEDAAPGRAPGVVRAGFWVLLAAGVVGIIGGSLFFALREEWARDQVKRMPDLNLADQTQAAIGLSWWLVLGAAMFLSFFLLLGYQALRGVRKARTLLLVIAVFASIFEYALGRVTIYGQLSSLLTLVGIGLFYVRGARRFYPSPDR